MSTRLEESIRYILKHSRSEIKKALDEIHKENKRNKRNKGKMGMKWDELDVDQSYYTIQGYDDYDDDWERWETIDERLQKKIQRIMREESKRLQEEESKGEEQVKIKDGIFTFELNFNDGKLDNVRDPPVIVYYDDIDGKTKIYRSYFLDKLGLLEPMTRDLAVKVRGTKTRRGKVEEDIEEVTKLPYDVIHNMQDFISVDKEIPDGVYLRELRTIQYLQRNPELKTEVLRLIELFKPIFDQGDYDNVYDFGEDIEQKMDDSITEKLKNEKMLNTVLDFIQDRVMYDYRGDDYPEGSLRDIAVYIRSVPGLKNEIDRIVEYIRYFYANDENHIEDFYTNVDYRDYESVMSGIVYNIDKDIYRRIAQEYGTEIVFEYIAHRVIRGQDLREEVHEDREDFYWNWSDDPDFDNYRGRHWEDREIYG